MTYDNTYSSSTATSAISDEIEDFDFVSDAVTVSETVSETPAASTTDNVISLSKVNTNPADSTPEFATIADRIRERTERGVLMMIENGRDLIAVKEKMAHGGFGAWLKQEFGWTDRTARNYMNAADAHDYLAAQDCPDEAIALLSPTTLYRFDNLSDEQKNACVKLLKAGDIAGAVANAKAKQNVRSATKAADAESGDKVEASPSPAESGVADLAKDIANALERGFARKICNRPGFSAPSFGKALQKEIARSFGEASEEAA